MNSFQTILSGSLHCIFHYRWRCSISSSLKAVLCLLVVKFSSIFHQTSLTRKYYLVSLAITHDFNFLTVLLVVNQFFSLWDVWKLLDTIRNDSFIKKPQLLKNEIWILIEDFNIGILYNLSEKLLLSSSLPWCKGHL